MRLFVVPCERKSARKFLRAALDLLHGQVPLEKVMVLDTKNALRECQLWCEEHQVELVRVSPNPRLFRGDAVTVAMTAILAMRPAIGLSVAPRPQGVEILDMLRGAGIPTLVGTFGQKGDAFNVVWELRKGYREVC